jgi:hypothetical protein
MVVALATSRPLNLIRPTDSAGLNPHRIREHRREFVRFVYKSLIFNVNSVTAKQSSKVEIYNLLSDSFYRLDHRFHEADRSNPLTSTWTKESHSPITMRLGRMPI